MSRIILKEKEAVKQSDLVGLKEAEEILKEKAGIYCINYENKDNGYGIPLLSKRDFEKMQITHYGIHFKNGEVTSDIKYDKTSYLEQLCELANCELWLINTEGLFAYVNELNYKTEDKFKMETIITSIESIDTYVARKKVSENSIKCRIFYDDDVYECKITILNDNHLFIGFTEFNAMNAVQKIITALESVYGDVFTCDFTNYTRNSRFGVLITKN